MALCSLSAPVLSYPAPPPTHVAAEDSVGDFRAGPLRLGMSEQAARKAMGQPQKETGVKFEPATGDYIKEWAFPKAGVEIVLSASEKKGSFSVRTIMLQAPCDWLALGKVRVGMPSEEAGAGLRGLVGNGVSVFEAFDDAGGSILFEESYNVLSCRVAEGKVTNIYLGPGPE